MRRLRHFLAVRLNWLAMLIVGFYFVVAAIAPLLAPPDDPAHPTPYRYVDGESQSTPLPPGPGVPLGTVMYLMDSTDGRDLLHFDIFYSLVWGTRAVLRFGLLTALTAATLGVIVGAVSGYVGGAINFALMRITDAFLAFPVIAGVWLFRTIIQSADLVLVDYTSLLPVRIPSTPFQQLMLTSGLDPVMLTLVLFSWMSYARLINTNIVTLKGVEYVQAAKVIGQRPLRIVFRHLLPNAIAPVIVLLARDIGGMVVMQAAFAFIGVSGTVNSTAIPEWSRLLMMGRDWIIGQNGNPFMYWWLYLPVTAALILFGIGWNLLGDGLNLTLNPHEVTHRRP
ncbi:MAG: ABC transporter permease [Anaerolineae bacterium]